MVAERDRRDRAGARRRRARPGRRRQGRASDDRARRRRAGTGRCASRRRTSARDAAAVERGARRGADAPRGDPRRLGGAEQIVREHVDGALAELTARRRTSPRACSTTSSRRRARRSPTTPEISRVRRIAEGDVLPVLAKLGDERILRSVAGNGAGGLPLRALPRRPRRARAGLEGRHEADQRAGSRSGERREGGTVGSLRSSPVASGAAARHGGGDGLRAHPARRGAVAGTARTCTRARGESGRRPRCRPAAEPRPRRC